MGNLRDRIERLIFGATAEERVALVSQVAGQVAARQADARVAALVDDLEAHFEEDVAHERTMANLASLGDVPADVLPDGDARTALVWLVSTGADVYAYPSGGDGVTGGTWCLWLGTLNAATQGAHGRVTVGEWCARWPALLAEMGVVLPAEVETETAQEREGRVTA